MRLERCHFFSFGTALHVYTYIFLPCRFKSVSGPSTGAILTAHTYFFHTTARLSVYTSVKAGTARLIGLPRSKYLVVLGTAKNLDTGAEPSPFTLSELAVPCPQKKTGTRTEILAVPCPKRSSVNGIYKTSTTLKCAKRCVLRRQC